MSSNYMLISNQTAHRLSESAPATFSLFFKGSTAWCITKIALTALTLLVPAVLALTYDISRGIYRSIVPISKKTNNPTKKEDAPKPKPAPEKAAENDFESKVKEYAKAAASKLWEKTPESYRFAAAATLGTIVLSNTIGLNRTINWTVKPILEIAGSIVGSVAVGILNGAISTVGDATPALVGTAISWIPNLALWTSKNSFSLVINNLWPVTKIASTILGVSLSGVMLVSGFNVAKPVWNFHVASKSPTKLVDNIKRGPCFTKAWSLIALPGLLAQKAFEGLSKVSPFQLQREFEANIDKRVRKRFDIPADFERRRPAVKATRIPSVMAGGSTSGLSSSVGAVPSLHSSTPHIDVIEELDDEDDNSFD